MPPPPGLPYLSYYYIYIYVCENRVPVQSGKDEVWCTTKIRVPGANEQRPNVRYGDVLRFRLANDTTQVCHYYFVFMNYQ
jgi:hypothetical protein